MSIDESLHRDMSTPQNFVYDSTGNLVEDKSKNLKISYDWRGMPVEFRMETRANNVLENTRSCSRGDSLMLTMAYDGTGRRVSKTRYSKACVSDEADGVYAADWERELVTHYTGIGTEVRENYRDGSLQDARVVVNMPQGLGRYGVEDAEKPSSGNTTFEWYLKNHLGSTMLVYGTQSTSNADVADLGEVKKAYDYRSFGEQIDLIADAGDKVTENFTGKEKDDETELNYFGARYLDPMLGLWISVDPKRQFSSPYLYAGNGMNPIGAIDPDGFEVYQMSLGARVAFIAGFQFNVTLAFDTDNPQNSDVYVTLGYGVGMDVGVPKTPIATPAIGWGEIKEGRNSEINAGLGASFAFDGEKGDLKGVGLGIGGGYYDTYTFGIGKNVHAQDRLNSALAEDYFEDDSHVFDDMVTDAD